MTTQFDAIVIGTGQAGPSLADRLNREGLKTAIIERKLVGGTCVNVGCIPTKTLVGSAKTACPLWHHAPAQATCTPQFPELRLLLLLPHSSSASRKC